MLRCSHPVPSYCFHGTGIFAAFVFCRRIPVVGEGLPAPLPKVAVLSEDGQVVGAEDEVEDEAVLDERRMIEGPVRYHLLRLHIPLFETLC